MRPRGRRLHLSVRGESAVRDNVCVELPVPFGVEQYDL